MSELWKPIGAFNHEISTIGRVRNIKTGHFRKTGQNNMGYVLINFNNQKTFRVSRLVALAFIPNPENKKEVNHINGIKTDNRVENLEWVSPSENIIHAYANRLVNTFGENHHLSKLSEKAAIKILKLSRTTKINISEIAIQYKVSGAAIYQLITRKTWKHLS